MFQVGPQGELLSEWWSPRPGPEGVGVRPGAAVLGQLLRGGNIVCAPSVVVRRDCLDALGPFDGRLPYTADWEMWMRAAVFFDVGYFIEPLVKYRRHAGNETLKFLGAKEREHEYRAKILVLQKCRRDIPGAEELEAELARQYQELTVGAATIRGEEGDRDRSEDARLQTLRAELEQLRAELDLVRGHITAMESSKFWRLRRAWFRLKRVLSLPADE